MRRAARTACALGLHELLPRDGQAQRREDLVRFFLVAREFDGDVRRAARDGGLDALLVVAMAELHQRLVVQPQPRDAARFGRAHERRGGRPQRTPLRETDELVARLGPAPALGHGVGRAHRLGQQRTQQAQPELARGDAFVALLVLVDDGVDARRVGAARLAESDALRRRCSAARSRRARARDRARCPRPRACGGRSRPARCTSSRARRGRAAPRPVRRRSRRRDGRSATARVRPRSSSRRMTGKWA